MVPDVPERQKSTQQNFLIISLTWAPDFTQNKRQANGL